MFNNKRQKLDNSNLQVNLNEPSSNTSNFKPAQNVPKEDGLGRFASVAVDVIKCSILEYLNYQESARLFITSKHFFGFRGLNITALSTRPNLSPKELTVITKIKTTQTQTETKIDSITYYDIATSNMNKLLKGDLSAIIALAKINCDSLVKKSEARVIAAIQKTINQTTDISLSALYIASLANSLVTAVINRNKEIFDWLVNTIKKLKSPNEKEIFVQVMSLTLTNILMNLKDKAITLEAEEKANLEFFLSCFKASDLIYGSATVFNKKLLDELTNNQYLSIEQSTLSLISYIRADVLAKHLKLDVGFVEDNSFTIII